MHERIAIRFRQVSKAYRLFGSQREQLLEVLGLERWRIGKHRPVKEFLALRDIDLEVPRGKRIGIIGRNGAGKTTLLKLVCGNFAPSKGEIEISGVVQALLGIGLGFHQEYTGRENIYSSLQYNGLSPTELQESVSDIIDFCELGQFIDQPFKTYSMGMQSRLMFAAATAIKPDILIIDEVLGAGDAYFFAKSKMRVDKLVNSGCTLLLVSHAMQQILELCQEAIWLEQGQIRMRGEAFRVVKAYEESVHGPVRQLTLPSVACDAVPVEVAGEDSPDIDTPAVAGNRQGLNSATEPTANENESSTVACLSRQIAVKNEDVRLQEPQFQPHREMPALPEPPADHATSFRFEAPGGISRWRSAPGIKVCGFSIITERGVGNTLLAMRPARFDFYLVSEIDGDFDCRYGILFHDLLGREVVRIYSPRDRFSIQCGGLRKVEILLNPNQIGPGDYILGISVLEYTPLEQVNSATRYDLLGRSFTIRVELPESLGAIGAAFFHTAEWRFRSA